MIKNAHFQISDTVIFKLQSNKFQVNHLHANFLKNFEKVENT